MTCLNELTAIQSERPDSGVPCWRTVFLGPEGGGLSTKMLLNDVEEKDHRSFAGPIYATTRAPSRIAARVMRSEGSYGVSKYPDREFGP